MDTVNKINTVAAILPVIGIKPGVNFLLPNLWVESSVFETASGTLAFRFYINDANDLTVHGWEQPYNNSQAKLLMKTSTDSEVELTNNVYLGNLYLDAPVVVRIKQLIRDGGFVAVVFEPLIDRRAESAGQLIYKVKLSPDIPVSRITEDDIQRSVSISSAVQTQSGQTVDSGILLNPSPPRNQ